MALVLLCEGDSATGLTCLNPGVSLQQWCEERAFNVHMKQKVECSLLLRIYVFPLKTVTRGGTRPAYRLVFIVELVLHYVPHHAARCLTGSLTGSSPLTYR